MSETLEKSINEAEENTESSAKLIGFLLLTGSVVAVAMGPIFMKISFREISANATLYHRLWIGAIIFGFWNGFDRLRMEKIDDRSEIDRQAQFKDMMLLVAASLFQLLNRLFFIWSLTQTSAANATILGSLTPVSTTLGAWLFIGQRFDRRFLAGLVLATVGAIALGLQDLQHSQSTLLGDSAALIAAFLYTGNLLILEKIRHKFSVTEILVWRCIIGTIFMLPLVLIFDEHIYPISPSGWLSVIALAAICEALGHGLLVYSLNQFSAAFIAIFFLLDPIIVALLAWPIFAESLSVLNIFVFAVILCGIYLTVSSNSSQKQQSE